jgi:aminoglycoside/choline kinase family phosphotransferase
MLIHSRDEQRKQWLAEQFGEASLSIEVASADASFRSYYRVRCDTPAKGLISVQPSYILMDAPPEQENCQPFITMTALLAKAGLNVPVIIATDPERGFLLLGDLGVSDYLSGLNEQSAGPLYHDALKALVQMQIGINNSELAPYSSEILKTEMQLFTDWFLIRHLKLEPDSGFLAVLEDSFKFLIHNCLEQPQVFVHRDYHSRNLMQTLDANPGILDYQDALNGPISYDAVSLLRDVYIRWPEPQIQHWLDDYHEMACNAGLLGVKDRPTLQRWFDLTGFQRHLKIAGIFARLYYRDHKPRYLGDIPLTLDYLEHVARKYPELSKLSDAFVNLDIINLNQRMSHSALESQS